MYEYSPRSNRAPGLALGLILFISAVILILPFQKDLHIATLLLGIGFLCLIASCSIIERFVLTDYIYAIESTENGADFTVTAKRFGKRMTVCRISVYQISEIVLTSQHIRRDKLKRYNYCPDLIGKNRYFMRVSDDREVLIRFSPDKALVDLLNGYINAKR
jgi:hypothetical protein